MSVARVTEIWASSPNSFEDAVRLGIERANKTLRNVQGRLGAGSKGRRRGREDHRVPGQPQGDLHPRGLAPGKSAAASAELGSRVSLARPHRVAAHGTRVLVEVAVGQHEQQPFPRPGAAPGIASRRAPTPGTLRRHRAPPCGGAGGAGLPGNGTGGVATLHPRKGSGRPGIPSSLSGAALDGMTGGDILPSSAEDRSRGR